MIRARVRVGPNAGGVAALTARLAYDDRHRRRLVIETLEGERVLLDLAEATPLRHGDRVATDDGRILLVEAEAEAVAEITAPDAATLTRLAWHLGNRHTPTAILADRLRIRRDHVLEAMVERLGGTVRLAAAAFDPEAGAYHDAGHAHDGGHSHDGDGERARVRPPGHPAGDGVSTDGGPDPSAGGAF